MKKFKKGLLSILSLALVAVLSIGGTIAYLTSEDEDVNVMTMGNVKIAQHEYERAENEDGTYKIETIDNQPSYVLKEFTQAKPLLPIVGDPSESGEDYAGWAETTVRMSQVHSYGGMQVFAGKVAQDKFVTVENTGKSDAYIRTLVAIEVGAADPGLVGTSFHKTWSTNKNEIVTISANGTKYIVIEYLYNGGQLSDGSWRHEGGVLPAGDTSYPSLSQVYLKSTATNEDCEKLDGNKNGALDILVLSQAVQTSGFEDAKTALDRAFGTPAEKAAEWFGGKVIPTVVSTAAELTKALANGGTVVLSKDIDVTENTDGTVIDKDTVLDLNGHTISSSAEYTEGKNGTQISVLTISKATVTIKNGNVVGAVYGAYVKDEGTLTVENAEFRDSTTAVQVAKGNLYIKSGRYSVTEADKRYVINCLDADYISGAAKVVITGGTFEDFNPAASISENPVANFVADGYTVVANGTDYTVVAE